MYLTFDDYTSMGGKLDETTFHDIALEAQSVIDWYTFGRLRKDSYSALSDDVKNCMYTLIRLIHDQMQASALVGDGGDSSSSAGAAATIASQSNDGVSVSYNVMSAKDAVENAEKQIAKAVQRYLAYTTNSLGRKVLYRGLYPDE